MSADAAPIAPPHFVEDFCSGMPSSYWLRHDHAAIREHAQIVWRRGAALAHIEMKAAENASTAWMTVVTDDRPGLLSLLSAAICAHGLDVLSAKIYCHSTGGPVDEAVDFFLVRSLDGRPLRYDAAFVAGLRRLIESLLRGEADIETVARRGEPTARPNGAPPPDIRFGAGQGDTDRLIVDAQDRPGLLLTITLALHRKGVRIVRSEVLTLAQQAHDEFELLDGDGSPLTPQRKAIVVDSVTAALAAMG
jgi:UTP:GlnB (protein PII) uridylyltransferase